jgi:hypothetical protein
MMLDGVQLSGLRSIKCSDCPKVFFVLTESTRTRCLDCEQKRESLKRRRKEAQHWHKDKKAAPIETRPSCKPRKVQPFAQVASGPSMHNIRQKRIA